MTLKVAKFGGSSVADAEQFRKVKSIVEADPSIMFVVVSAPGKRNKDDIKITDMLYSCAAKAAEGEDCDSELKQIKARYDGIIKDLGLNISVDDDFQEISQRLGYEKRADYAASRGEYLCAKLMAEYLGATFVDAAELVVFDNHGHLLDDDTNNAIREALDRDELVVIPGFYGTDLKGNIRTFSRGGSDITGALVARAMETDIYENWTDVSGFLMTDPRIVDDPQPIARISYAELRELSYMGASVLHEDAIFPTRAANIPINIRNTNRPQDPGTIISNESDGKLSEHIITGIAGIRDFLIINIYKRKIATEVGFARKMAAVMEGHDISIEHLPNGIDTASLVLRKTQVGDKLEQVIEDLMKKVDADRIEVNDDVALIATVGEGMFSRKGTAARLFTALANADINIKMIDQGSSELNIIVGVEGEDFTTAIKAIYGEFVK